MITNPLQAAKTGPEVKDAIKVLTIAMNVRKWYNLNGNEFYNFEKGRAFSNAITNTLLLAFKWFPDAAFIEPMDPWDRAELLL